MKRKVIQLARRPLGETDEQGPGETGHYARSHLSDGCANYVTVCRRQMAPHGHGGHDEATLLMVPLLFDGAAERLEHCVGFLQLTPIGSRRLVVSNTHVMTS